MIVISQSGESIDTLMAMREAKRLNLTTAITNVENSSIDESDYSILPMLDQKSELQAQNLLLLS